MDHRFGWSVAIAPVMPGPATVFVMLKSFGEYELGEG